MSKEDGKSFQGFESAIYSAFNVEVSEEKKEEKSEEELLSDQDNGEPEDYNAPVLRKLFSAGKAVCRGKISDEDFKKIVDEMNYRLDRTIKQFSGISNIKASTFTGREEAIKINKSFSLNKEGLEEIYRYFEDCDTDHILDGLDIIQIAVNGLRKSFLLLKDIEKDRDFLTDNPMLPKKHHRISCEQENSVELILGKEKYYTSPNLEKLRNEVRLLKDGKINKEKFSETLHWMENILLKAKKQCKNIKLTYDNEESEEIKLIEYASLSAEELFESYEEALEEMKRYFVDNNSIHLDKGLQMAFEATQIIDDIQKLYK